MTGEEALRFIHQRGVVLESARGAAAVLADAVLGTPRRGSWWGHRRATEFFRLTRYIRAHPDVLVCRLVEGKITYVHRRLWPALARLAARIEPARLAAIREEHTASGAHRVHRTSFRKWAAVEVGAGATVLTEAQALAELGEWVTRSPRKRSRRRQRTSR